MVKITKNYIEFGKNSIRNILKISKDVISISKRKANSKTKRIMEKIAFKRVT